MTADSTWQLIGAGAAVLTVHAGVVLWAVRGMLKTQAEEIGAKMEELQQVRTALADHQLEVAKGYIRRDDAVIFFSRFEQKIDALWEYLRGMKQPFQATGG